MQKCIDCKHLLGRDICYFCGIDGQEITHPLFMGGKKCPCYEKYKKTTEKFNYPQRNNIEVR